jgi:hypothetical protein
LIAGDRDYNKDSAPERRLVQPECQLTQGTLSSYEIF